MAGEANFQRLVEKIEDIENILMGDTKRPDQPGALECIRRNTGFREGWQKLLWRFYLVLAGMIAIQIFNLVVDNIK